jgi:hypothetical protein
MKWLALLAAGHAGILFGQQPAAQQPVPAESPVPEEIVTLERQSRSHLRLATHDRPVDVYLFAEDQKEDILLAGFCGGDRGTWQYTGNYQLISVSANLLISKLDLDPDDTFVDKKPHDGARLFHEPKTGQDLIAIFQYGSCNNEIVRFYALDPSGNLFAVPFLDKDSRNWRQMVTGPSGEIAHLADGSSVFCTYANDTGYDFCETYAFDGANFLEAAKWMTQELGEPLKGNDAVGQAKRALFDFLSELVAKDYPAAAYYFAGKLEFEGAPPDAANPAQKVKILEAYCTSAGGQCLMPTQIESETPSGAASDLLFRVSFQTSDFRPFQIGDQSSFEFRVTKKGEGFKVLDLPPRVPEKATGNGP